MLRTFEQERLEVLASAASVPVVNALSDFEHPCQCLADLLTIKEVRASSPGRTITYLGDGNNVTHSLLLGGAKSGMHVRAGTPPGFEPIPQVVQRASDIAAETGGSVTVTHDPIEASRGADVLYTDVWASMGQEAEADERALRLPGVRRSTPEKVAVAAPGRDRDALPAGAPWPGDRRRRDRQAPLGRVGPGREPDAHAEGLDAVAPRRRLSRSGEDPWRV